MTASLADYLPFAGLVNEGIMLCKDGSLLHAWRVEPHDLSYQDESISSMYIRNIGDIFRSICEQPYIIYADCRMKEHRELRRYCSPDAPEPTQVFDRCRENLLPFFQSETYITLLLKPPEEKFSLGNLVFGSEAKPDYRRVLNTALDEFKRAVLDIGNMLKGTYRAVWPLDNDDLLTYLHASFSDSDHPVKAPDESFFYLDEYLSDGILRPDVISKYNDTYVSALSIRLWPSRTSAGFMSQLISFPMVFRVVNSFEFITKEKAKQRIKSDRKTHFRKRQGVGQVAFDAVSKTQSELEDTDMLALTSDASQALSQISDGYTTFGYLTCTIILMHKNYEKLKANCEAMQSFVQDSHFICKTETLNNPLAYLGAVPGNYTFNAKRYTISTRNLAHFFPLSAPWEGETCDEHLRSLYPDITAPFLNAYTSFGRRPFNLNLSYKGCGHTMLVGPTGMGKTVCLCTMCISALKYPRSRVVSFDKGGGCRNVCRKSGGAFLEFNDTPESLKLNPFYDIGAVEKISQVSNLLVSYLKAKDIALSPSDEHKVFEAVESLAAMPAENRGFETFCHAVQNSDIRLAFQPFIDGEHAYLFKNGTDSIQDSRWIAFEMEWLMTNKPGEVVEFILNYLFIVISRFLDGNFMFITLDEAWVYIRNKTFCAIIDDILRTWRKKNAYAVLTTQNANDAFSSPIYATILNACYTKILTPNPRASKTENIEFYKSLDMSANDLYVLESIARPNADYFFISPHGRQLFDMHLSREELDLMLKPYKEGVPV